MLLTLDDTHKKHLQFLNEVDANVAKEFCRISTEFIIKGVNTKVYQTAAQKLEVDADTVRRAVEGLMHLLKESAKYMLNELDFRDSVTIIGLPEESKEELVQWYLENQQKLRTVLCHLGISIPRYSNLEWRVDVQVASRCLRNQVTPLILMKMELDQQGKKENVVLQTDPVNLNHLIDVLDQALHEARSQHTRRIMRHIK